LAGVCVFVAGCFLFLANTDSGSAQTGSSDAIAIRVIPNPEHLSARNWYRQRGFSGSPQSLTVDGYEAVRDGRTVYANVANVSGGTLYTNIYLISYNQKAEKATKDIFSEILSHWKFNTNLNSLGSCRQEPSLSCRSDDDCAIGDVCDSPKARVVRDTKRLSDLADIKVLLNEYHAKNGSYPDLRAGSYLTGNTLSVWPSWRDTFSRALGKNPPVDPVNDMGECPGHNEKTCWDEDSRSFATDLPELPDNSLTYIYSANSGGSSYSLYTVFESGLSISGTTFVPATYSGVCLDFDGDGYGSPASSLCPNSGFDCDDTDPAVTTGSPENTAAACGDGSDNDCDGMIDCADADCAGVGPCAAAACNYNGTCEPGLGETCANCAADGCCGPATCPDGFCDETCECPSMSTPCPADCYCGNGTCDCSETSVSCPSDCGSPATCTDTDGDGYGVCPDCGTASGCTFDGDDCDDSSAACGSACNPGASEVCDGYDNDCDGTVDEGFSEEDCGFVCTDMGYDYNASRSGDLRCCGDDSGEGSPFEATESSCSDGNDNDCDGFTDMADSDCSGSCNDVGEHDWTNAATPGDCNQCDYNGDQDGDQNDPGWSSYPAMVDTCDSDCGTVATTVTYPDFEPGGETSCDGLDNDCDGTVDEGLSAPLCAMQNGVCSGATQVCGGSAGWQACGAGQYGPDYESGNETSCDGLDNDCDGTVDEGGICCEDSDGDGYDAVAPDCASGDDCDDSRDWINPGQAETCDTFDNNCSDPDHSDGVNASDIDEGCDNDGDGYCDAGMQIYNNTSMCTNTSFVADGMTGDDCVDTDDTVHPGASEACDGVDNDCDGTVDEGCASVTCYRDSDGDGYGNAADSTTAPSCSAGWVTDSSDCDDSDGSVNPGEPEDCADSVDNDCDGDIDCSDSDCSGDPACTGCSFPTSLPCTFS